MKNNGNAYIPSKATVREVSRLSHDVNRYTLKTAERLQYKPGQFFMVSVFGAGEVPISVSSSNYEDLALCIRKVGSVTAAIHDLREGDIIGIRGPYGNGFPLGPAAGRDVVVIAGGLGILPLRPLLLELIDSTERGSISLLYGAKSPGDALFADEIPTWEAAGVMVIQTVDCGEADWKGCVGVVTSHMDKVEADFSSAAAFLCGPEVMISATMRELSDRGMPDERIITTLEAHMKCGVGKCGHCYKGAGYICTSGPVFTLKELKALEARN